MAPPGFDPQAAAPAPPRLQDSIQLHPDASSTYSCCAFRAAMCSLMESVSLVSIAWLEMSTLSSHTRTKTWALNGSGKMFGLHSTCVYGAGEPLAIQFPPSTLFAADIFLRERLRSCSSCEEQAAR